MNCKIVEIYNIFIYCEVIFEMRTADSEKTLFYNYVKNVEMKMTNLIFTLFIFVAEEVENELIFKCL